MKVIRIAQVIIATGLGRSTIYKYMNQGQFPQCIKLSERCSGWLESEVHQWIQSRISIRDIKK